MRPHPCSTLVLALVASASYTAIAQDEPRFEVVSIRRNVSNTQQGSGLSAPQPGGRYVGLGVTLRRMIGDAYHEEKDLLGGPDWADRDRFDVNARGAADAAPADIRRMLRSMLADRFKLRVHTETRDMAVYLLSTAREDRRLGGKMRQSDAACAAEARKYFPGASGFPPPCGDYRRGARSVVARGMTMDGLAGVLARAVGRPVLDRTGLGDTAFDLELEWTSNLGLTQPPPDSAGFNELQVDGLSLFTALQEQLGLRLEPGRGAVPVLVIDAAEPPSPD